MQKVTETDSRLSGKVHTVLGSIAPQELGVALCHEHLLVDLSAMFKEPEEATARAMAHAPVTMDMLWWLRSWRPNLDNKKLSDEQLTINEVLRYKAAGGNSIVELTSVNIGRDPVALAHISRATGLNVIMGSGYYVDASWSSEMKTRTEEEITEEIVKDLTEGVGTTGIKSGIIGEIGCSWPLTDNEIKSLRAAARAQQHTGAPLNIHPGHHEEAAMEILHIIDSVGGDISRTAISHVDRTVRQPDNRIALARTGCYLEYDLFGHEGYYPPEKRIIDLPNDHYRLNEIAQLIDAGYLNHIVISQDVCNKDQLCTYGGWGYEHILRDVVPVMRLKQFSEEIIHTILVENPRRLLTFAGRS